MLEIAVGTFIALHDNPYPRANAFVDEFWGGEVSRRLSYLAGGLRGRGARWVYIPRGRRVDADAEAAIVK